MRRTLLLATIAFASTFTGLHGEEPGLRFEGGPFSPFPVRIVELIPHRGTWTMEYDEKLDGELKETKSRIILLEEANYRLVGQWKDNDDPHAPRASFFTGQLIPGAANLITLRQDIEQGFTVVYSGRLVENNRFVGSYYDNHGRTGDWSLTLGAETTKTDPLPEKKIVRVPAEIDPLSQQLTDDLYFESVLGAYGRAIRGDRSRFINLRPPNRNLWTEEIENALDGTLSYEEVDYIGTAKLLIPERGTYTLEMPGANVEFRINNQRVAAGDLELKKGVYEIEIYTNHWGQPYLKYAQAFVHKKGSSENIPFVNAASDVERFLKQKIGGKPVTEVCDYTLKRVKIEENQALRENDRP